MKWKSRSYFKECLFKYRKGDFVAIIGQSGSGKSTLMNIIGCLDTATSGSYKINGKGNHWIKQDQLSDLRSQKFGFIFQRYNLLSSLTAAENVACLQFMRGCRKKNVFLVRNNF